MAVARVFAATVVGVDAHIAVLLIVVDVVVVVRIAIRIYR